MTSSNKRTILQLPYSFLISVIPVKKCHQKVFVFIKLSFQTNATIDNRLPQWNYITPKRSRVPFPQTNLGIPLLFLIPVESPLPSCIHDCITSISPAFHSILGQKWCTLYLSLFGPSNQIFHLQVSARRNLNRGICHTPIFDLRSHFICLLARNIFCLFGKISAKRYFKIPHFLSTFFSYFILLLLLFFINIFSFLCSFFNFYFKLIKKKRNIKLKIYQERSRAYTRTFSRTFSRTFWSYYKWNKVTSSKWHHMPTFFHLLQTWSPSYNFGLSSKCPKFYK